MDILSNKTNGGGYKQKLLSIVIPTYNREVYLKRTLDGFIEQIQKYNLTDFVNIVVSDNASSDNTAKLLKEYQELYPIFFSYNINEENLGFGKNLQKVVELAYSKYVWTCGDDDIYRFGIINVILEILKDNELDVLVLDFYDKDLIDEELKIDEKLFIRFENKEKFLLNCEDYGLISSCIFLKKFFLNTLFYDDILPQSIKILNASENTIFTEYKDKCIFYNKSAENIWHKDEEEYFLIVMKSAELYEQSNCSTKVKMKLVKETLIHLIHDKRQLKRLDILVEKIKNFQSYKELTPFLQGELSIFDTLKFAIINKAFYVLKYPKIYRNSSLRKIIFMTAFYNRWMLKLIKKCYNFSKEK